MKKIILISILLAVLQSFCLAQKTKVKLAVKNIKSSNFVSYTLKLPKTHQNRIVQLDLYLKTSNLTSILLQKTTLLVTTDTYSGIVKLDEQEIGRGQIYAVVGNDSESKLQSNELTIHTKSLINTTLSKSQPVRWMPDNVNYTNPQIDRRPEIREHHQEKDHYSANSIRKRIKLD